MIPDEVYCQWCRGEGCVACFNARQKREVALEEEYARQFPNGPQPIFTVKRDDPEQMAALRRVAGVEALEKAFGPGGGGVGEIEENARREIERRAA
jgi:hypothetical protein